MRDRLGKKGQGKQPQQHPPTETRRNLELLRSLLLDLHKTVVDSERVEYEKTIGQIRSPNHFLQLLTSDPWFVWLSPFSQLIVSMDEALDAEEPVSSEIFESLLKQSAQLLVATESGAGFSKHYFEALQRDPAVVLAHAKVASLPGFRKSQK